MAWVTGAGPSYVALFGPGSTQVRGSGGRVNASLIVGRE